MQNCPGCKPNEDRTFTLVIAAVLVRNATKKASTKSSARTNSSAIYEIATKNDAKGAS